MTQLTPSRPAAARPTLAARMRGFALRLEAQPALEAEVARTRAAARAALDAWRRCLGDENERAAMWRFGFLPAMRAAWDAEDAAHLPA